jgi:Tfp pilus assembly protein PilO
MEITFANLKVLAVPLILLAAVAALSFFGGRFVWSQLGRLRQEVKLAQKNEQVLQAKVNLLQSLQGSIAIQSSGLVQALPEKNSSVTAISQIKLLASESGLLVSNLLVGGEIASDKAGLSRAEVKFEVEGAKPTVVSFLKQISQFAPITSLEDVRINDVSGVARATVTLSAYWSGYPDKLPAIAEPLETLTAEEQDLISEVLGLREPIFVNLSPSVPLPRPNPFAL